MKLVTKLGMVNQDFILIIEAGFALLTAGRIGEAIDVFCGCCDLLPGSELPYIGIARSFAADGKLMRAEEWARRATRVKTRSSIAWLNLAEILLMQGKRVECRKILKHLQVEGEDSPEMKWKRNLMQLLEVDKGNKIRINKK